MKTTFINHENDFHDGRTFEIEEYRAFSHDYGREYRMQPAIYEMIGGAETIGKLVDAFYKRVQAHPTLSPLFPDDIIPVRNKQYKFLTQFFGGPHLYSDVYGSPMMRAKHLPHPITPQRAEEWLGCMAAAMDEIGLDGPIRDYMFERLTLTAHHMVNSEDQFDGGLLQVDENPTHGGD